MEDVESAALSGLWEAALRYADTKGSPFLNFSYFHIRGRMFDMIKKGGYFLGGAAKACRHALGLRNSEQEDSAEPSKETVAWSAQQLSTYSDVFGEAGIKLFYDKVQESIDLAYAHAESPETVSETRSAKRYISSLIDQLPPKQKAAVRQRYWGEKHTALNGVSRSRACRHHARALKSLKAALEEVRLKEV